jgi:PhnB protein
LEPARGRLVCHPDRLPISPTIEKLDDQKLDDQKLWEEGMADGVTAIPAGYRSVTPYLVVADAAAAIAFYHGVFGAREVMRLEHEGKIVHAEVEIGDCRIMLADEFPAMQAFGPRSIGGTPVRLYLYLENVDRVVARAEEQGATVLRVVQDQFYGDRVGTIEDPFGHLWHVATHREDVSADELRRRAEAAMARGSA